MLVTSGITPVRPATFPLLAIVSVIAAAALLAIRPTSPANASAAPMENSILEFDTDAMVTASHQNREQKAIASYESLPLTFIPCSSGGSKTGSCTFTLTAAASVSANVQ